MPKLTNEQLAAIHLARKVGVTKKDLFTTEVARKEYERTGKPVLSFKQYVKEVRKRQDSLEQMGIRKKPKIIADKLIMEEMLIRDPDLKSEFLRQPRITEHELEKMR